MKQKVLNVQMGTFWDQDKKKNVPVILSAYPKKAKDGKTYYQANINIFVNEMEVKDEKTEEPRL